MFNILSLLSQTYYFTILRLIHDCVESHDSSSFLKQSQAFMAFYRLLLHLVHMWSYKLSESGHFHITNMLQI